MPELCLEREPTAALSLVDGKIAGKVAFGSEPRPPGD
jgi:hypothetical protein